MEPKPTAYTPLAHRFHVLLTLCRHYVLLYRVLRLLHAVNCNQHARRRPLWPLGMYMITEGVTKAAAFACDVTKETMGPVPFSMGSIATLHG